MFFEGTQPAGRSGGKRDVGCNYSTATRFGQRTGQIALVLESGRVLLLEMAVERLHFRDVPIVVERGGYPDVVPEPDVPQPLLMGGVDGVLAVMHDHRRHADAEVLQVAARQRPGRQNQGRVLSPSPRTSPPRTCRSEPRGASDAPSAVAGRRAIP